MSSVSSTTLNTPTGYSNSTATTTTSGSPASGPSSSATSFSGTSKFAQDLQQAVTRAVAIASMPITQLNNRKSLLLEQQKAFQSLQGKVDNLSSVMQTLSAAMGLSSYSASNSDPSAVAATLVAGALSGTYKIDVLNAGSSTLAMSATGLSTVTDPTLQSITPGTSFTLSVDGKDTTITLGTASLNALATAINTSGAGVQATIINIGAPDSPDYRLSLESAATADVPIQLSAAGSPLLDIQTHGSQISYQVNGQPPAGILSSSRSVTISPGLTATLLAAGSSTLSVGRDVTALGAALSTLVTSYNSTVTELGQYHGQNGGVLQGQREVLTVESSLRNLLNFSGGNGSATSLFQMGLSFDKSGQLHFNSSKLDTLTFSDLQAYFGDGTQGGFIQNAHTILTSLDDPLSGTLPTALNSISSQIKGTTDQIDSNQLRVNVLQTNLTAQMAAADAAISMLQDQSDYFTNLFEAMKQASQSITNS